MIAAALALVVRPASAALHLSGDFAGRAGGQEASGGGATRPGEHGYGIGMTTLALADPSRPIRLRGGRVLPRPLMTVVRYPAAGGSSTVDTAGAAPAQGPFPLVVFAHGFDVTPATYTALLRSWARAGFVVAAPLFPRTNPHAPGGPDEEDVVNQPADMSFVITALLSADATPGVLEGLIEPGALAVAGHSDGAETALAVADARRFRDPRVRAAIVMSGAEMSGIGGYRFTHGPPLLAIQGTRDRFNEPRYTDDYYSAAAAPKYLLRLLGAGHLPPYTTQQPQLAIVERVTTSFLEEYLGGEPMSLAQVSGVGSDPRVAALASDP